MMTPEQIDALPDYTPEQMLKLWRKAEVDIAVKGRFVGVDGRQITRTDIQHVRDQIAYWERRVAEEASSASGDTTNAGTQTALAVFPDCT